MADAHEQKPTPVPGYWMHETSGVLAPAVRAILDPAGELTSAHVLALRSYLRQWLAPGVYRGERVGALRARIGGLTSRASFMRWFADALEEGIDPL